MRTFAARARLGHLGLPRACAMASALGAELGDPTGDPEEGSWKSILGEWEREAAEEKGAGSPSHSQEL